MPDEPVVCCRCGDGGADVWWNTAPFIQEQYWLCSDCVNAVLLIWVIEHEGLIEEFRTRKAAQA